MQAARRMSTLERLSNEGIYWIGLHSDWCLGDGVELGGWLGELPSIMSRVSPKLDIPRPNSA